MPITINGSGTITGLSVGGLPNGTVDTDTLATTARGKVGQVIQVVQDEVKTTTAANPSSGSSKTPTYFAMIDGLQPSITPVSNSSKILIFYDIAMVAEKRYHGIALWRDSTLLTGAIGAEDGNRSRITKCFAGNDDNTNWNYTGPFNMAGSYLDSPSTTSAITYKIGMGYFNPASATTKINCDYADDNAYYSPRTISTVTLMEYLA